MTGSHEVEGSNPSRSTNLFNRLAARPTWGQTTVSRHHQTRTEKADGLFGHAQSRLRMMVGFEAGPRHTAAAGRRFGKHEQKL